MEVTTLERFSGAWVERGQSSFMRMAVKAEYDFSEVSPRVRKPIIIGIRSGVLSSTGGQAASVYRVICEGFGLKYVCASKNGGHMYTNFNTDKFYEAAQALYGLTDARQGRRYGSSIHRNKNHIICYDWQAKDEATRNIFAETIGYADKERREEAIDFLCDGKKMVQTWIDRNPNT